MRQGQGKHADAIKILDKALARDKALASDKEELVSIYR
jgi:hypothetical protein